MMMSILPLRTRPAPARSFSCPPGSTAGRPGFLLLEIMLGIAVFGLFLAAAGLTILHGQEGTVSGGDRIRATYAAERALEAARTIRDGSFASLTAGTHGITLGPTNRWAFSGTESTFSGGYVTSLSISALASNWYALTSSVHWKHGHSRSGSVVIKTELTDWKGTQRAGDWTSTDLDGSYTDPGAPYFNKVAVRGNYAYVTSEVSGDGLYVFDITTTSSPSRVSSSFTLGAAGYGVAVRGDVLYVVTSDASQEIRAYDISGPTSLDAGDLLASYNLPGSALGVSLAVRGSTLLLGATLDASQDELYAFDVSDPAAITLLDSLDTGATVNALTASATGAYLATADAAAEMKAVRISSTGALSYPGSPDTNITSGEAGRSIALSGTSALLGRTKGAIQEMTIINTAGGTGPWYHEGSGSLVGIGMDQARCYAFLAAESSPKAFQVVDLRSAGLSELAVYHSTTGQARGLLYDIIRDRVYLLTRRAFLILKPSSSVSVCS